MKWGKKKKQSFSASSRPFFVSQVFPTSWIAKFKQMGINSGQNQAKMKQKGNSVPSNSPSCFNDAGKFYGGDGDAFWRLSFGEENLDGLRSRAVLRSVRYDSDDDLQCPPSSCQNYAPENHPIPTRVNMVSHAKKIRKFPQEIEMSPQVSREKVAEIRTPRLRVEKEKKLRKGNQRVSQEKQLEFDGVSQKDQPEHGRIHGIIERKDCCISPLNSRDPYLRKIEEECIFTAENESDIFREESFLSEWQKLKERKIKELKSRNEEQRKSLYISRELQKKMSKQNSKVRSYSPRTASRVEICKIKALEDMKKAKLKMKKKAKEKTIEGFQGLESFAVVKCSYDPQKDFRDSMMEMIEEKKISKPEELEELLACYLTLNSDEYHDLIIRVFRQVWLDLTQACFEFDPELDK